MIYTVTLNPGLDKTLIVPRLTTNEVLRAEAIHIDIGGKGFNVSKCLQVFGVQNSLVAFIGGNTGIQIQNGLTSSGLTAHLIHIDEETRTNTVIIDQSSGNYIKVNEPGPSINQQQADNLLNLIDSLAQPEDIWVLSGRLAPGLPDDFYAKTIRILHTHRAYVWLDSSGIAFKLACQESPFLVKPNKEETEELFGSQLICEKDYQLAVQKYLTMGIHRVALSLGDKGLLYADRFRSVRIHSASVTATNPVGAGDALLAGLLFAFLNDLPLEHSACWGVASALTTISATGVKFGPIETIQRHYQRLITGDFFTIPSVPPHLMNSEPGSFAAYTIQHRKPQIIDKVISENAYPPEIVKNLYQFKDEIADQPVQPVIPETPQSVFWNSLWEQYRGQKWCDLPWYFAETFFYRRLLDTVDYFQPGEWYRDNPFRKQKQQQIKQDILRFNAEYSSLFGADEKTTFISLLHSCLWGNRTDLSNIQIDIKTKAGLETHTELENILIDHTENVYNFITANCVNLAFINDNVGHDILFDLALTDFLLNQGWVKKVTFFLKEHPFFVSDAMPEDIPLTINFLKELGNDNVRKLSSRLSNYLHEGKFTYQADWYWNSALFFTQMPIRISETLKNYDLAILKGDVNYRRLLEDRHWSHTASLEDFTAYFPTSFVSLRTLKAEIMVGLSSQQINTLMVEDLKWLVNGKRGLIHFVPKDKTEG